jgi:hypothetical protein
MYATALSRIQLGGMTLRLLHLALQLHYVVAVGRDGVMDVAQRYTASWSDMLQRRTLVAESWLAQHITAVTRRLRTERPADQVALLEARDAAERKELDSGAAAASGDVSALSGGQAWGGCTCAWCLHLACHSVLMSDKPDAAAERTLSIVADQCYSVHPPATKHSSTQGRPALAEHMLRFYQGTVMELCT